MAKTYENSVDEAREILQDTVEPYRYSDASLLNILNRALQSIARIRPDAYWDTFSGSDIVVPEITSITLTDNFPLPMQFYAPVVNFIVAWAEVLDDEFTQDGRAGLLMQQFKMEVMGL